MKNKFLIFLALTLLVISQAVYAQGPEPNGIDTIYTEKSWIDEEDVQVTRPDSLTYRVSEKQGTRQEDHTAAKSDQYKTTFKVDNLDDWNTSEILPSSSLYRLLRTDPGEKIDLYQYPTNTTTTAGNTSKTSPSNRVRIDSDHNWYAYANGLDPSNGYHIPAGNFYINNNFILKDAEIIAHRGDFGINRHYNIPDDLAVAVQYSPSDTSFTDGEDRDYTGDNADHAPYVKLKFTEAVTVFSGNKPVEKDLYLTITIQHIHSDGNENFSYIDIAGNMAEDRPQLWLFCSQRSNQEKYHLSIRYQIKIEIDGLNGSKYTTLLPFSDIDMAKNSFYYNEGVGLTDYSFDKNIYTINLKGSENNRYLQGAGNHGAKVSVSSAGNLWIEGQEPESLIDNGFYYGLLSKAHLGNGDIVIYQDQRGIAGTAILTGRNTYMSLKKTVNGETTAQTGGTITQGLSDWDVRDFGEAAVVTLKPNQGYHISKINIDGKKVSTEYSIFPENGVAVISDTGFNYNNTGKENITLYLREKGVVDVYLPKQYLVHNGDMQLNTLVDHWIDVEFARNPREQTFTFTNLLGVPGETAVSGTKTWLDGGINHDNAEDLNLTLYRWSEYTSKEPVTEYEFRWAGNTYYL